MRLLSFENKMQTTDALYMQQINLTKFNVYSVIGFGNNWINPFKSNLLSACPVLV